MERAGQNNKQNGVEANFGVSVFIRLLGECHIRKSINLNQVTDSQVLAKTGLKSFFLKPKRIFSCSRL
jgi:hypothetical protein